MGKKHAAALAVLSTFLLPWIPLKAKHSRKAYFVSIMYSNVFSKRILVVIMKFQKSEKCRKRICCNEDFCNMSLDSKHSLIVCSLPEKSVNRGEVIWFGILLSRCTRRILQRIQIQVLLYRIVHYIGILKAFLLMQTRVCFASLVNEKSIFK